MRDNFDDVIDGLTWYLLSDERRSRDFNATAYQTLIDELKKAPLSESFWGALFATVNQWNQASPPLSPDEIQTMVSRALANTPLIASALGAVLSEVADANLEFIALDPERIVVLYRAVSAVLSPDRLDLAPLVCHLIVPSAFPAHDREVTPVSNEGDFLNDVVATQRLLRRMRPGYVAKISALLQLLAMKSPQLEGRAPENFPGVLKLAQLCALGAANPGYFASNVDAEHGIDGFGRTMKELAAYVAAMLNHDSGEAQLDEIVYQRYANQLAFRVDIRRSFRSAPVEERPEIRQDLLTARRLIEGGLFWLYRCRAPRDFLFHSYQQSSLHAQSNEVLTDSHLAEVLRALRKVGSFLSPDMNLEQLEVDLVTHRGRLNAAYLEHVRPYVDSTMLWTSLPSPDDGAPFFDMVRALPNITNDTDASWVCHVLCPGSFAPLAEGGEHFLGVDGYVAYNARVKDLFAWSRGDQDDPFTAALWVLQYIASGDMLKNFQNTEAAKAWPLVNLAVFLSLNGLTHPGIAQQLADESASVLPGLLHSTSDFVSSVLYIEGCYHGMQGWVREVPDILDSIRLRDGRPVVDQFVVPTQLFRPGNANLEIQTKVEPKATLRFPIRLVDAPAVRDNFSNQTKEEKA